MLEITIDVAPGGEARWIHHDDLRDLLKEGQASITRASHVEPGDPAKGQDPLRWYADLGPVAGPLLGPYETRRQALEQEVAWLESSYLNGTNVHKQRLHQSRVDCSSVPRSGRHDHTSAKSTDNP